MQALRPVHARRDQVHSRVSSRSQVPDRTLQKADPKHPALRASPFPKVTDLICRLPLLTFFYETRGCSPWRPAAVIGTTRSANKSLPRLFKDRQERTGHPKSWVLFPAASPSLWVNQFQGRRKLLKRKENSSQGSCRCRRDRLCYHTISTSWVRNFNRIPFR